MTACEAASAIAARLHEAGYTAYFAGGCVRDHLLGLEPTDYDIATDASTERIAQVFKGARGVGESFGVMLVRMGGRVVEVATFRADGPYSDGRRPDHVRAATEEEDAHRRDFTVNGLFQDPATGKLIDHVNGRVDLEARVLRAIDDPLERFREDRLRMLRAARFAARFALEIEPVTADAIRSHAHELAGVSRERIGAELRKMLVHPTRVRAAQWMESLRIDGSVLGEGATAGGLNRLGAIGDGAPIGAALAAWWMDRRDRGGAQGDWVAALMLSNHEAADFHATIELVRWLRDGFDRAATADRRLTLASSLTQHALDVLGATHGDRASEVRRWMQPFVALSGGLAPARWINGGDLLAAGVIAGPTLGAALDAAYRAQLDGVATDRDAALAIALARSAGPPKS